MDVGEGTVGVRSAVGYVPGAAVGWAVGENGRIGRVDVRQDGTPPPKGRETVLR